MNQARYEALPDDLKAVLDANSGLAASKWVGRVMDEGDLPGIEVAKKSGNKMILLGEAEVERWKAAAAPLVERSEEHTSELQSLMRISYAVFCLKKKKMKIYMISNSIIYHSQHRFSI